MAKKIKKSEAKKSDSFFANFDIEKIIPSKYQIPLGIAVILIVFLIFFSPIFFGGQTFQSGDIITIKSMSTYIHKDREGFSLWNPYLFCGMPAYAISTELRWWDFIGAIYSYGKYLFSAIFSLEYSASVFNLILIALTSFIFMRSQKASLLLSLLVGFATSFSTGILLFLFIGHVTKMISLAAFPLILMMLLKFNEKIRFLDFLLMVIFLHFLVFGAHVQIIYYVFMSIGIFYLFYFIRSIVKKENQLIKQLIKSVGLFVAATLIAMLLSFDSYAQLWEYSKYSTRGTKSLIEEQQKSTDKGSSDFYEYATNWSFSPEEMMTFIVPSFYGSGRMTYKGELSNNQPVEINTYFGQMPFVDVPMYMGIVIFFLALFAIITKWKNPFIQYLTLISILYIIISFGKNFPVLFNLLFYYFPFFDKFRVPSMILAIVQMVFPILAGYGIMSLIEMRKTKDFSKEKLLKNTALVFGVLFVLSILFQSAISDWYIQHIQAAGEKGQRLQQIFGFLADTFTGDLIIGLALITLTFTIAFVYLRNKLSTDSLVLFLLIFVLFDLLRIGCRGAEYVNKTSFDQIFTEPDYIKAIKEQNDKEPYRILNLKKEGLGNLSQNSNFNVYFLEQDFYGYSAVKPRTYQDFMDIVGPANPTLWRMLNVKYLVFDNKVNIPGFELISSSQQTFVYKNTDVLPRAYFVDSVSSKPMLEILNMVKNNSFDPKRVAFLEDVTLKIDEPDSSAFVKITHYGESRIELQAKASGNNFLFLGDTYYPKGWKAFIDGAETTIYKTNHGFRGIVVPKGEHKIIFIYEPKSFYIGKYLSLILSVLILIVIVGIIFFDNKAKKQASNGQ
ncbi:YfhO family protein [Melioribacteraceae bacterium 4301-Me]|uniref:YfhO family protein n=1 Tax=Pyranulibacter aquaticus TaxID=3163344 RepID=UPI0035962BF5